MVEDNATDKKVSHPSQDELRNLTTRVKHGYVKEKRQSWDLGHLSKYKGSIN